MQPKRCIFYVDNEKMSLIEIFISMRGPYGWATFCNFILKSDFV